MSEDQFWEAKRRQRAEELLRDEPDAAEHFGPGSPGTDTLLDRAHLASSFFQQNVLEYPACVLSPELWRQAAAIVDLMEQFYQNVGEVCADEGVTSE
jgi:hypothetical protein